MSGKQRGQYSTVPCVEQRLEQYLDRESRYALEDEYWDEMQEAAANDGTDAVTLAEETPFEEWLRKRRETYSGDQEI